MKNRRRGRRNRDGFTLMEILLVTAILIALASMVTFSIVSMQRSMTSRTARTEIGTLETACNAYYNSAQAFPQNLQDLQVMPQGLSQVEWGGPYLDKNKDLLDPWKIEYKYTPTEDGLSVVISSAGPDRQHNTEDDVSNVSNQ